MENKDTFRKILKNRDIYCERAETKRLLYVALTRVQTHLVISGAKNNKILTSSDIRNRFKSYESPDKLAVGTLYRVLANTEGDKDVDNGKAYMADCIKWNNDKVPSVVPIPEPEGFQHRLFSQKDNVSVESNVDSTKVFFDPAEKPESFKYIAMKGGVKEAGKDGKSLSGDGPYLGEFPELVGKIDINSELAADFGTLCHEMLESRFAGKTEPRWNGMALSLEEMDILEHAAASIADRFFSSEFYDRYIKAVDPKFIHPEFSFMMLDNDESEKVLEGSVDLFIEGEDCNIVVDYKTDRNRNPEDHEAQLTRYCNAMSDIFGGKRTVGYVVYLRTMEAVQVAEK